MVVFRLYDGTILMYESFKEYDKYYLCDGFRIIYKEEVAKIEFT